MSTHPQTQDEYCSKCGALYYGQLCPKCGAHPVGSDAPVAVPAESPRILAETTDVDENGTVESVPEHVESPPAPAPVQAAPIHLLEVPREPQADTATIRDHSPSWKVRSAVLGVMGVAAALILVLVAISGDRFRTNDAPDSNATATVPPLPPVEQTNDSAHSASPATLPPPAIEQSKGGARDEPPPLGKLLSEIPAVGEAVARDGSTDAQTVVPLRQDQQPIPDPQQPSYRMQLFSLGRVIENGGRYRQDEALLAHGANLILSVEYTDAEANQTVIEAEWYVGQEPRSFFPPYKPSQPDGHWERAYDNERIEVGQYTIVLKVNSEPWGTPFTFWVDSADSIR